jgi:hypothetical protein
MVKMQETFPVAPAQANRVLLKTCHHLSACSGIFLVRGDSLPLGEVRAVIAASPGVTVFLQKPVL